MGAGAMASVTPRPKKNASVGVVLPVYLPDVSGHFEEKAASFQDDQDQVC